MLPLVLILNASSKESFCKRMSSMSHKVKYKNFKNIKNELFKISFYFQGIVNHNEANIDIINY